MKLFFTSILMFTVYCVILTGCGMGTWGAKTSSDSKSDSLLTCDELIYTNVNRVSAMPITGTINTLMITDQAGKSGFAITLHLIKRTYIILSIEAVGAGRCIGKEDLMEVTFRNGSKLKITNDGNYNCDSNFAVYFGGLYAKKDKLEHFVAKEVQKMKIKTQEKFVEKRFSKKQSQQLRKSFECIKDVWDQY